MTRRRDPGYLGRITRAELDAAGTPADVDYAAEQDAALERIRQYAADVAARARNNDEEMDRRQRQRLTDEHGDR